MTIKRLRLAIISCLSASLAGQKPNLVALIIVQQE